MEMASAGPGDEVREFKIQQHPFGTSVFQMRKQDVCTSYRKLSITYLLMKLPSNMTKFVPLLVSACRSVLQNRLFPKI